jgi:hypothetical protein
MTRGLLSSLIILFTLVLATAQTTVTGKVTEAATGAPVPFATVTFLGTTEGTVTDFDGNFQTITYLEVDSISVTYIGFSTRTKAVVSGQSQTINFQLEESLTALNEVVVLAGENPAISIFKSIQENKRENDKRELDYYEYESYVRTEIDIDHITDDLRNSRVMQQVTSVMDSIEHIAGDDGLPILPILISEAISKFYYRKNPEARHEEMIRTRLSGVGITDGTLTSQVIGGTFQEYNFYQNWLNIWGKEFASPIADGGRLIYEYYLLDSAFIEDDFCYLLEFFPRQEQDLAFTGTMWITKDEFALRRIDAQVGENANLNYLERIRIQQDLIKSTADQWLPSKTRVVIKLAPLIENRPGFIGKFYVSNTDFLVNEPRENDLYLLPVSMDPNVRDSDDQYWREHRHDSLTSTEENVFRMIDSLKQIPRIRFASELSKFLVNGYIKSGKIDIGPYTTFIGNNNIEGTRIGFGARTNLDFSNKWVLGGYFGYGFGDERLKYSGYLYRILDRTHWTTIKFEKQREVDQVWLLNENIDPNSFFYSYSRFGTLTQPFLRKKNQLTIYRQIMKGLNAKIYFRQEQHRALFPFEYFTTADQSQTSGIYQITETGINLRYGRDEIFVINDNERLSMGTIRSPLIEVGYIRGFEGPFGGDFEYHKVTASVLKRAKMGLVGVTQIELGGGQFFGEAPYPMLFNPIGNQSPFFVGFAYNLMDYFEFSADRYAELKINHSFEGFLLNRVPLLRRLKLRAIANANAYWGSLSAQNISTTSYEMDANNHPIYPFRLWENMPYVEAGYGVSNIARVLSIQAFHRITYLDQNARRFGVKFSLEINL